jgi:hypothetical protein
MEKIIIIILLKSDFLEIKDFLILRLANKKLNNEIIEVF